MFVGAVRDKSSRESLTAAVGVSELCESINDSAAEDHHEERVGYGCQKGIGEYADSEYQFSDTDPRFDYTSACTSHGDRMRGYNDREPSDFEDIARSYNDIEPGDFEDSANSCSYNERVRSYENS